MNRRNFMMALPALALSACATPALFKESQADNVVYYDEHAQGFFVTADGKNLVVLGKDYHYVMDDLGNLPVLLKSSLKPRLQASFEYFSVSTENKVDGHVYLTITGDVSEIERKLLQDEKFQYDNYPGTWKKTYHAHGTRYSAKGFETPTSIGKFNQSYTIRVAEHHSPGLKRAIILLTPVTLAVDGVLVLGGIVMFPLAVGVLAAAH